MIDEISLKILKILQEKARIPNVEVARQVGLAPSAVLERIRKLEKQGFIDGYEVRLNPERFAKSLVAFVHVKLKKATDEIKVGKQIAHIADAPLCPVPPVSKLKSAYLHCDRGTAPAPDAKESY